ncbi:carbohydrate kinase family protein [Salinigranum marinum]|uniref:carbohydrate kinase family protein n=1 Tax=Salinigranum marinum TaxID=1515595 RepID=UPI002989A811|nr:carbohydrate kinase family protein [Salinigranum marinum]
MTDVLVLGDAIVDAVFDGLDRYPDHGEEVVAPRYELRPGGSAGYASLGLTALGTATETVASVGDGVLSTYWLEFLRKRGVDTSRVIREPHTSISVAAGFLFETDRSFVTYRGASEAGSIPAVTPTDYDALLIAGFSQAPYLWTDDVLALAREFSAHDRPVFLDPNWSPGEWQPTFSELLPSVDYLLVNHVEARRLTDCDALVDAGELLLDEGAGSCVITAGERGCLLVDDEAVWVDAEPVDAVDACGAGDFFNAGFVRATLRGADRQTAAALGNRCASTAIASFELREKLDGIAAAPSLG